MILFLILPSPTNAADQCPDNATPILKETDPACWTSESSGYWRTCTWYGAGTGSYWVCDGGVQGTSSSVGTNCRTYLEALYSTCGGYGGCSNRTDFGPGDTYDEWVGSTSYTCHYIKVKEWDACTVDGNQYAIDIEQHTTSGTSCDNLNEKLTQSCGVCTPGENIDVTQMPTKTGICAYGTATTPELKGDDWVWQCLGSNNEIEDDDAACSVPNNAPGICNPSLDGMILTQKPQETKALCTSGIYKEGSLTGPAIGPWTWTCDPIGKENSDICNATCLALTLDAPEFVYLKEDDNKITAKVRVEGYDNINEITKCTVNGDDAVTFSSNDGVSDPFTVDVTGASTEISVTCDISGPCNSGAENSEQYTVSKDVKSMCVARSCNSQGTCQAVPQPADSVDDCTSTCSSDADCSTGRMIETRP